MFIRRHKELHVIKPLHSPRGFTLIELLVVIATIALLATLVIPSLLRAKALARAAHCRSNLRQVHIALAMYEGEHQAFPPMLQISLENRRTYNDWLQCLYPYSSGESTVFICPQASKIETKGVPFNIFGTRGGPVFTKVPYGYNAFGSQDFSQVRNLGLGEFPRSYNDTLFRPIRESDIVAPAEMIAIGDRKPGFSGVWFEVKDGLGGGLRIGAGAWISPVYDGQFPGANHLSKSQILFVDGHVESQNQQTWISSAPVNRSRWNNDHQPHLE